MIHLLSRSVLVLTVVGTASIASGQPAPSGGVELLPVVASPGAEVSQLRGELRPYQEVDLHARVEGFVERVLVDRGAVVKAGQRLAVLSAPELDAKLAEAVATRDMAQARLAEAQARLTALQAAEKRLADAAKTPGVVSGQELVQTREDARAAQAAMTAAQAAVTAADAAADATRRTRGYLELRAPFAGVVTERLVHPGALVGPATGPALRLAQVNRLRLVVAVPEGRVSGMTRNQAVTFMTAAYPGVRFTGRIARDAGALDRTSRTMAVEADVANADGRLAPGMYADVAWPGASGRGQWRVPASAVVRTTQRVFVIRARNGAAEWVDVRVVSRAGDAADIVGPISPSDRIVRRASDELRDGAKLTGVAP